MSAASVIIFAEDNPKLRTVYHDLLRAAGYSVLAAADGVQALRLLSTVTPKLILLDIMMPNLNGIETCKRARKIVGDDVPIVFLSAFERLDMLHECVAAGGDDYLIKSDSLTCMLTRIEHWIGRSGDPQLIERRANILAEFTAKATNGIPTTPDARTPSSETNHRVRESCEFVRQARAVAAKGFGKTVEEKLYLIGYVTGVVEHWSTPRGFQDECFFDCLSAVLHESSILTNHEVSKMLAGFEELATDARFGVARAHGRNDTVLRQRDGDHYVPVGLAELGSHT